MQGSGRITAEFQVQKTIKMSVDYYLDNLSFLQNMLKNAKMMPKIIQWKWTSQHLLGHISSHPLKKWIECQLQIRIIMETRTLKICFIFSRLISYLFNVQRQLKGHKVWNRRNKYIIMFNLWLKNLGRGFNIICCLVCFTPLSCD